MAVTEEARHELYRCVEDDWGKEVATTLIDHLPPGGWAKVATKDDIAALREHMDRRFTSVQERTDIRFTSMQEHMDIRFTSMQEQMDHRFTLVDERFVGVNEKIDHSLAMMTSKIEDSISRVTADLLGRQLRFVFAMLTFLAAVATIVAGVVVAL